MTSKLDKSGHLSSLLLQLSLLALLSLPFWGGSSVKPESSVGRIADFFQRRFEGSFSKRAREGLGIADPHNWMDELTDGQENKPRFADYFHNMVGDPATNYAIDSSETLEMIRSPLAGMWLISFWRMDAAPNAAADLVSIGYGEESQFGFNTAGDESSGWRPNTLWAGRITTEFEPPDFGPYGLKIPPREIFSIKNEEPVIATRLRLKFGLATMRQLRNPS